MQVKSEISELKSLQKQVKTITFHKQQFSRYKYFHSHTIFFLRVPGTFLGVSDAISYVLENAGLKKEIELNICKQYKVSSCLVRIN